MRYTIQLEFLDMYEEWVLVSEWKVAKFHLVKHKVKDIKNLYGLHNRSYRIFLIVESKANELIPKLRDENMW